MEKCPVPAKATVAELAAAYGITPNVWRVAEQFGMCGQSVHERLAKAGIVNTMRKFTNAERMILLEKYAIHADARTLDVLAAEMGRTKPFICRQARDLNLTDWSRVGQHNYSDDQVFAITTKIQATMMERYGKLITDSQESRGKWKGGHREIAGRRVFFRSRWEANYGRYLQWLKEHGAITEWEHEPITFWFEKIRRGTRSYLPDFRVTENNGSVAYHEVKGWMTQRSATAINRMRIYHPTVTLIVIPAKTYRLIEKQVSGLVAGWERDKS